MQAFKQILIVPLTRELRIQLPEEATANEQAEVIVLFKSTTTNREEKLLLMQEAANDELFLADLREVAADFADADAEEIPA